MSRWFDSLLARMLLVQAAVAMMVVLLFAVPATHLQSQAVARTTAPLWAAALAPLLSGRDTLPVAESVQANIRLLPGPPPDEAAWLPFYRRFRALASALEDAGVPVRWIMVSGHTGEAVTWLEIDHGSTRKWIGVQGELAGSDLRQSPGTGLGLAIEHRTAVRHGGSLVWGEAAPGLCAELRLPLPAVP